MATGFFTWSEPMDPHDVLDYESDWTTALAGAGSDTIVTSTFTLSSAATAAGVQIHQQSNTTTKGTAWLKVSPGNQEDAGWDGAGAEHYATHKIVTAAGRTINRRCYFSCKVR